MAKDCLKNMKSQSIQILKDQGYIRDELPTNIRSNAVPWLMKEVKNIVNMQKTQHRDLNKVYKDVSNKGKKYHMTSINNEE